MSYTIFEGYILGKGNNPGDVYQDKEALFAVDQLQTNLRANI
ncbi:hypothetical protein ACIQZI_15240 [Peribacillus sp. NPDC096379]